MYYVLSGKGTVTISGTKYPVGAGDCLYIPSDAEHGVVNDGGHAEGEGDVEEEFRWLYVFAADDFGDIVYRYS